MITESELDALFEIGIKLAKQGHMQGVRIIEEAASIKNSGLIGTAKPVTAEEPEDSEDSEDEPEKPVKSAKAPKTVKIARKQSAHVIERYTKIIKAFKKAEAPPTATVQELAELTGYPPSTVYADLRKLKDEGKVIVTEMKGEGSGKRPDLWAPATYRENRK